MGNLFLTSMNFLEKNLEDIIYENIDDINGVQDLMERGLEHVMCGPSIILRQFNLKGYGIPDLIQYRIERTGREKLEDLPHTEDHYNVRVFIYELKKDKIDISAVMQVHRYKTAINEIFKYLNGGGDVYNFKIECILVGSKIDNTGDLVFLYNNLLDTFIYTYDYKLDGLLFELQNKSWINSSSDIDSIVSEIGKIDYLKVLKSTSLERIHQVSEGLFNG